MARRHVAGSRVLITGASSGIGAALARELVREGARLVLNARSLERLQSLAAELGPGVALVPGDITHDQTRQLAVQTAQSRFGGLDTLVNNAGVGAWGRFQDAGPDRLRRIMEVNFFALAEMTRVALPLLRVGSQPLVVNVASILGQRGIPRASEYCASKFAVRGLSESLRSELAVQGIGLLVVSPGTTASRFEDNLIERSADMPWPKQPPVPSEVVARRIVRAMRLGKHEIVPNFRGWMLCFLNRLAPRMLDAWMARYG